MGHLGRKPISRAWRFVFFALVINYLGQGAFILRNSSFKNALFELVQSQFAIIYIPFLTLTLVATIIASQALISGVFSIVHQGISYSVFPRMKVDFTSSKLKSQIYIPSINWFLMISVLFMLVIFKTSESLAVAYGLAVSGTMTITGILVTIIYHLKKKSFYVAIAVMVTLVDAAFFIANLHKLPAADTGPSSSHPCLWPRFCYGPGGRGNYMRSCSPLIWRPSPSAIHRYTTEIPGFMVRPSSS
jgi:KUP system potassium uptake protein